MIVPFLIGSIVGPAAAAAASASASASSSATTTSFFVDPPPSFRSAGTAGTTTVAAPVRRPLASSSRLARRRRRPAAAFAAERAESSSDEAVPPPTMSIHSAALRKPMGLILEEVDASDPTAGVVVQSVDPNGPAAAAPSGGTSAPRPPDVCVRDRILEVDGVPCDGLPFDDVMDLIVTSASDSAVSLKLGREAGSTAVRFHNGVCVAALPGESIGFLGRLAGADVPYECRNGVCGTCERLVTIDFDGEEEGERERRYMRPCVARVPKGTIGMDVRPTDRYA